MKNEYFTKKDLLLHIYHLILGKFSPNTIWNQSCKVRTQDEFQRIGSKSILAPVQFWTRVLKFKIFKSTKKMNQNQLFHDLIGFTKTIFNSNKLRT
jgi:hypothetical protein